MLSSVGDRRDPSRPRRRAAGLRRRIVDRVPRTPGRGEGRRRAPAAVGPGPDLGRVRWDARICGTFRSWASELTVPGGARLPAAAVSAVCVLPTHRRRGIMRSMVAAEHGAARERGEAFGLLYAAEYPIYGRFGYGPALSGGDVDARRPRHVPDAVGRHRRDRHARRARARGHQGACSTSSGAVARRGAAAPRYRWDFDFGTPTPGARSGRASWRCDAMRRAPWTATSDTAVPRTNGRRASRGTPSKWTSCMP